MRISSDYRAAVVAAPSYLKTRTRPQTPHDLSEHRCIAYRFVTSRTLHQWRFAHDGRELKAAFEPSLIVDEIHMAGRAALHGLGLSYVVRDTVADYLRSGALVEVLEDWSISIPANFLY